MDREDGPDQVSPADRLRARAAATDRAARFELRLEQVQAARERRVRLRRVVRVAWAVALAAAGALTPLVVAAVLQRPDPEAGALLLGAGVGAVLGAAGPTVRERVARRRGPQAWDAYHERHVLLGDPSARIRDADRPRAGRRDGPPPPAGRH